MWALPQPCTSQTDCVQPGFMLAGNAATCAMRRAHSLAISPNLDALLEHEERVRGSIQTEGQECSQELSSPASAGNLNVVGGGGLRPPPRGTRRHDCCGGRKKSKTYGRYGTEGGELEKVSGSSSTTNPFINPAPTADEIASQQSELYNVVLFSDDDGDSSPRHRPLHSHARSSSCSSVLHSRPPSTPMLLPKSPSSSSSDEDHRDSKPSTPKPLFFIPVSLKPSRSKSPSRGQGSPVFLPPTTNFLDTAERADLIKKSRKLTRMFGETPDGDMLSQKDLGLRTKPPKLECPLTVPPLDMSSLEQSYPTFARRHSIPATPHELSESCYNIFHGARASFIDLSDEEEGRVDEEAVSPITFAPNPDPFFVAPESHPPPSPSQLSLSDPMTPELPAEEQRRRNREKLAKLHRFLGSRVPADLVLGRPHPEPSLPPIQPSMSAEDSDSRKQWLRRRRSSSAGALPSWTDAIDRMKEDLNDKEKAINVRRAQKMEKLFGVAPPQTLYHTRHSPSPSVPTEAFLKRSKSPPNPSFSGFIPPGEVPSPTYQQRNPNRSSYIKQRPKKADRRPSTAESSRRLLPEGQDCYNYSESPVIPYRSSLIYQHYQHSLKSLGEILDRDDKESLAELHQYLNDYEDSNAGSPLLCETTPLTTDRRLSNASSMKSERRRSLPARTSILSLASEYSVATPKPEVSEFQLRRRRAAKLTQFFGVNYRELINDVLESLETGLEHERKRGTLRADELEDLLERLRKIKMTRKGFF